MAQALSLHTFAAILAASGVSDVNTWPVCSLAIFSRTLPPPTAQYAADVSTTPPDSWWITASSPCSNAWNRACLTASPCQIMSR